MTLHLDTRMNQRGIKRSLLDLALNHGEWDGDRCVLSSNAIKLMIRDIDSQRSLAMRALDKGGLVVVEAGGETITTYRMPRQRRTRH
jgi:hypothetical protein